MLVVGSFNELAVDEGAAGADERDQVGPLTARQRSWAASISLNAIDSPAAREPGRVGAENRVRASEQDFRVQPTPRPCGWRAL